MSNYPMSMSRADLIHVGEIEDPDCAPDWFGELINERYWDDVDELWQEFNATDWFCESQAQVWLEANYPDAVVVAA